MSKFLTLNGVRALVSSDCLKKDFFRKMATLQVHEVTPKIGNIGALAKISDGATQIVVAVQSSIFD